MACKPHFNKKLMMPPEFLNVLALSYEEGTMKKKIIPVAPLSIMLFIMPAGCGSELKAAAEIMKSRMGELQSTSRTEEGPPSNVRLGVAIYPVFDFLHIIMI